MLKYLLSFLIVFVSYYSNSQESHYKNQIRFSTDNDLYIFFRRTDQYYSYGGGFEYAFKAKKVLGLQRLFPEKTEVFYNLGMKLEGYTPSQLEEFLDTEVVEGPESFDRPFAGVSYLSFSTAYIFERSFFKTEILTGVLGPSSGAAEVQDWVHKNISDDLPYDGWQFQLKDQLLVNLNFEYLYDFNPNNKWLNFYGMGNVKLGNLHIQASPSVGIRFGKFEKSMYSTSFKNELLSSKKASEFFFQMAIEPRITIFNATIQGDLFNSRNNALSDLNTLTWHMSNGIYFLKNRFSFNITYFWETGVVEASDNHVYGTIGGSFRF